MKKLLLLIFISVVMYSSCAKDNNGNDNRNFNYFNSKLQAGMTLREIKSKFGEPDVDMGSGIHIYVYRLKDNTEIWIGYTDRILYARHLDTNQQVLHILI